MDTLGILFERKKSKPRNIIELCNIPQLCFTKAHMTTLPTISQAIVFSKLNPSAKIASFVTEQNPNYRDNLINIYWKMESQSRVPIAIIWCHYSNTTDSSSIWSLVIVLWWVVTHLVKSFMDTLRIWFVSIKSKSRIINEFHKLPQVFLANSYVTMLTTITWTNVFQNWPLVQKLHYALLKKIWLLGIVQ